MSCLRKSTCISPRHFPAEKQGVHLPSHLERSAGLIMSSFGGLSCFASLGANFFLGSSFGAGCEVSAILRIGVNMRVGGWHPIVMR